MAGKERPVLVAIITAMSVIIAALITSRHTVRSSAAQREDVLEARVKELETELAKKCSDTGKKPIKPPVPLEVFNPVIEGEGLRVQLLGCTLVGDEVRCQFSIMSMQNDFTLYIRSSRLVHDGQELGPSAQQFGASQSQGSQVYAELVRNVPMKASVAFAGLASKPETGRIDLVELMLGRWPARFRSVPLQ